MKYLHNFHNCALTLFLLTLLCTSTQGHGPSQAVSRLIIHSVPELSPANATNEVFSFQCLKNATFTPYPIATLSLPNVRYGFYLTVWNYEMCHPKMLFLLQLPKIRRAFSVLSMYSKDDSKFETYVLEIEGKYSHGHCHGHGHGHSHGHGHGHSHDHEHSGRGIAECNFIISGLKVNSLELTLKSPLSYHYVVFYAFLGVTLTNLCSLTGVICVPLKRWKHFDYLINFMIGLAVSALFSASILVLIPEVSYSASHKVTWRKLRLIVFSYLFHSLCGLNRCHWSSVVKVLASLPYLASSRLACWFSS